jgi:AcrR family transcriptional regulator
MVRHGGKIEAPEMGTTAPADVENPKVRQVLEAAHALFLELPYDAVSTDAIAKAARISKTTMYVYFPSKEALFSALVRDNCQQTAQSIWNSATDTDDVEEALRAIAQNFTAMFATTDALAFYRTIIAQVPRFPELGRIFYESGPKAILDRVEFFLREASARGDLAVPDPALAASQFLQLISVDIPLTGLLALEPLTTERVTATIESGLALFLKGYRPPSSPEPGLAGGR